MPPLVIAHRACPNHAPENSLEGVRKAAELGADAVEVDVQRTLDGVPILMHDRTLWRTARCPLPAWLLPWALVRRLRLRDTEERVPSLDAAFAGLPPGLSIAVELKYGSALAATIRAARARGVAERTLIWSEDDPVVARAARDAPETEVALLRGVRDEPGLARFLDDAVRLGARAISADWRVITPEFVERAHGRGLRVYSLAPRFETTLEHVAAGVDGAITDWPDRLREAIG